MSHQPGGGPSSKNVVRPNVRTGSGSHSTRPAGTNKLGNKQGSHVTRGQESSYRSEPLHGGRTLPTKFGNEVALNVGKGGCGTGRTIYSSGSQSGSGGHGPSNPGNPRPTPSRHIIENYGPDYRRPGNPRSDTDADF